MSIAGSVRRAVLNAVYPAIARRYRQSPASARVHTLRRLGIAEPSYRPEFYTLASLAEEAARNGGLIAECGVFRGSTVLGMAHRLRTTGAHGWHILGFDSFEGFPEPSQQDALADGSFHPHARKGSFSDTSYDGLQRRIEALGYANEITLVKGYFESTLPAYSDREFVLAHLDCDLYASYVTCLNFFYPRVRSGGYLVFDEYDFSADIYPGAQKAIDEFLADKPEKAERLPDAATPRYFIRKR